MVQHSVEGSQTDSNTAGSTSATVQRCYSLTRHLSRGAFLKFLYPIFKAAGVEWKGRLVEGTFDGAQLFKRTMAGSDAGRGRTRERSIAADLP